MAELGSLENSPAAAADLEAKTGPLAGLKVTNLSGSARKRFGVSPRVKVGVVVTDIAAGSAAQRAGLQAGDVILEVNRRPVESVAAFDKYTRKQRDRTLLLVHREGQSFYLMLRNTHQQRR